MSRKTFQNASSSDTEVRCPLRVKECLTGLPLIFFEFQPIQTCRGLCVAGCIKHAFCLGSAMQDRIAVCLLFGLRPFFGFVDEATFDKVVRPEDMIGPK